MFIMLVWLAWIPKNAKTIVWAKLKRQDVFIAASDSGKLPFLRGNTEGPGIFRSHDGTVVNFIPRGSESWINKTFHYDKIGFLVGYIGKAISGSFETNAVLAAHELLQEHKNNINKKLKRLRKKNPGKTESEMQAVFRDFLKNNPEGVLMLNKLKEARANITKLKRVQKKNSKKPRVHKKINRLVAILLDPRIIQNYFTNTVQPSQANHLIAVAYNMGYRDGSNPMAKFGKIILIALIIIIPVAIILLLLIMGGG